MLRPSHISHLHVERGTQMRECIEHDVAHRGMSFESAVESLAKHLGVERQVVELAVAIANEWNPR